MLVTLSTRTGLCRLGCKCCRTLGVESCSVDQGRFMVLRSLLSDGWVARLREVRQRVWAECGGRHVSVRDPPCDVCGAKVPSALRRNFMLRGVEGPSFHVSTFAEAVGAWLFRSFQLFTVHCQYCFHQRGDSDCGICGNRYKRDHAIHAPQGFVFEVACRV